MSELGNALVFGHKANLLIGTIDSSGLRQILLVNIVYLMAIYY